MYEVGSYMYTVLVHRSLHVLQYTYQLVHVGALVHRIGAYFLYCVRVRHQMYLMVLNTTSVH